MEHIKIRCKHCKKEYIYCTYGNGPEYGTEEGCSREYCAECQQAIDNALANIPIKFKPIKVEITDEEKKKKILSQLYDIKTKAEKNDVFHVIRLLNSSNYDNIDIYTYNSKTYYVEYNDDTPNDKHLLIEMEYDIIAEKVTSKSWKTTHENSFQHARSIINEFKKAFEK
jgi:hypothetical protein